MLFQPQVKSSLFPNNLLCLTETFQPSGGGGEGEGDPGQAHQHLPQADH